MSTDFTTEPSRKLEAPFEEAVEMGDRFSTAERMPWQRKREPGIREDCGEVVRKEKLYGEISGGKRRQGRRKSGGDSRVTVW